MHSPQDAPAHRKPLAALVGLALLAGLVAPAGPAVPALAAGSTGNAATLGFLDRSFSGGRITLYGNAEYGVSIEAMLARKAGGYRLVQQLPEVRHILTNRATVSYNRSGYLHKTDGSLRVGRAGLFLFASVALGVPNRPLQLIVYNQLKPLIAADGKILLPVAPNPAPEATAGASGASPSSTTNTSPSPGAQAGGQGPRQPDTSATPIDYAWLALGLLAFKQPATAERVLRAAEANQASDGGYRGFDQTSSIDATGLVLQAQAALKAIGGARVVLARKIAVAKSVAFLQQRMTGTDHWVNSSSGSPVADVNGTAYAAMGLAAAGHDITPISAWLSSQRVADGGLATVWSNGAGDAFATAQAATPMFGKSYVQLLGVK